MCLKQLGNISDQESYALRNSPQEQHDCLEGTPSTSASEACATFNTCLEEGGHKDDLLEILTAVFGATTSSSSLATMGSIANAKHHFRKHHTIVSRYAEAGSLAGEASSAKKDRQSSQRLNYSTGNGCFNPYAIDPEAWDCECLDKNRAACQSQGLEFPECTRRTLCNHCEVCSDWKNDRCSVTERQEAAASCTDYLLQKRTAKHRRSEPEKKLHADHPNSDSVSPADMKSKSRAEVEVEHHELEALRKRSIAGGSQSLLSVDEDFQLESMLQTKCA
jgi:hypothetical protein